MSLLAFLLETVLISLSGVMAPGPITAVAIGKGSESPHAGAWVAVGHGLVEFPLIALVFWGFGRLLTLTHVKSAIALVGGLLLLWMGIGVLRSIQRAQVSHEAGVVRYGRFPVLAGILLSAGNPFFLIWWVTVGAALIARSTQFGLWGLVALALVHWSCDLGWCYFLSALSFKGGRFVGRRFQEVLLAICGAFLLFFGGKYIADAVGAFLA